MKLRRSITLLLALTSPLQAAPPDLTAAGVIATINRTSTYNLGPTGLRGWIYIGGSNGADGTITSESRQILVTVASAPGNTVLAVDDVILGAIAGSSGSVPLFTSDARKAFGAAIGDAEKTEAGTLRVKRWSAGITTDVNIPMTIMGNYADTAPYSSVSAPYSLCPKSALILSNARDQLVGQLFANPNFLATNSNTWASAISGLALLASVEPGYVHPTQPTATYDYVQTRLQTFARALAPPTLTLTGCDTWDWGYIGVFLSEYYLSTGDPSVVAGLNTYTVALAKGQSRYGTFGHGGSLLKADGSLHGTIGPYGPVNQAGIPANIAIVMGKKALLAAGQTLDPAIDPAIQRGGNFFAYYVNKGSIPYGEHMPYGDSHASNGKDPLCAVLFGLQDNRTTETEFFTRMSVAGYTGREYGHTGQGFSYLWGAMGANMGGALAVAEYLKPVRWHLDLERRTDGSFVYDGGEQYGAGSTADGTYLGKSGYYEINPTASYILTYALPLQRRYITGKNAIPANTLDATKVANAIAAGTFKQDCTAYTTTQLIAALSEYDPVVRSSAAIQLATRTLTTAEIDTLLAMLVGTNANGRMGACQTLGILKNATALPLIAQRLSDPDLWVRAQAAIALRTYDSATASAQLTTMLTAFTANATDPDVIVWDDPIQLANGRLSLALFGNAVPDGSPGNNVASYTIAASKSLLYPAVRAGLKQPDSYPRTGAASFCYNYLTLADVQALIPDLFEVVETESQADTMWSMNPRGSGIATLAKYKISEGIPEALAMQVVPTGFGWGCDGFQVPGLNALAAYGDAARWTLPALRGYLGTWNPAGSTYTTLVNTIASIEAAITAPAQNLGLAVANPQVVATTGAKAITLTGTSPRSAVTFTNVTAPAHGTLTGTAPNLIYTPTSGYTGPDSFTFQVTDNLVDSHNNPIPSAPGTVSIIVGTAGTGLKGEYFDNINFTNLKLTRTDAQVNFDWTTGSPDPSITPGTFSVRWSGLLLVPETGTYKFSTLNSDGVRLYVDGVQVIDDYVDQTTNWIDGAAVNLTAGQLVDLQMEYYKNTGSAAAKLKWTGPSFAGANGTIIAKEWLYDGTGAANRTAYAHAQSLTLVQNTAQAITLTGSGGTLTYTVITPPAHGTLTGIAPYLTYTPANNFSGSDSFTFLVNNGTSNSFPATVSLSVWAGLPVSYTWKSAAAGNWSLGTNWTGGATPAATGQSYYNLNFAPSGTYTVTDDLNNGFLLNQLNMAGAVTLAGSNSITFTANGAILPQFNQNSSSAVTINTPLNLAAMTTFGGPSAGQVTISSLISGTGGLTKNNAGTLQINNAANTYSGGTIINTGTISLGLQANAALGTGPVTINQGGTLVMERVVAVNPLTLNGGTIIANNGFGDGFSGLVTVNTNSTIDTEYNFALIGNVSGAGGFTKTGHNTLILSGTNSFTGSNKIATGTLTCSKAAALGSGPLDITSGAKVNLNYTGTRTIAALTLGGTSQPVGTYGSTASPATNKNDSYFSGTGTVTVGSTTTTLALTVGATPADPGTPLTFTATVTGSAPTGSVAFYAGTTLLGSGTLNGSSQASITTGSLAIGSYSITAQYAGNSTNAASTSAPLAISITSMLAAPPVNLLAAPGNNHVALTWTMSAGATGYHVQRSLANGGPYTVIGNPATAGYDDLTAVNGSAYYYVVSATNAYGESANSSQVSAIPAIQPSATAVVSSPVMTGVYGASVTFTASVTLSGAPATGAVTFKDGDTEISTSALALDGTGQATCATSALAVTNHLVTATYNGDTNYAASVSAPCAYSVTPKALTLTGVTAANKEYDGSAIANLTVGVLSGVINGETVTVVPGTGTFDNPNVGSWPVRVANYDLGGANAGNYVLAQPAVPNATITPRPVQLSVNGTRTYDATATIAAANLRITNMVTGDDLTLTGSATLDAKDVGTRGFLSSYATPARVQSATGSSGTSNVTSFKVNLTTAPVSGNTLIAVISTRGASDNQITGITQAGVTSWSRATQAANASGTTTEIWYASNIAAGAGTQITINQASLRSAAVVVEYSGVLAAFPLDQTNISTGSSNTAATGTTATTTLANELWLGGIGIADGKRTLNAPYDNSFTVVDFLKSGSSGSDAMVYALEKFVSTTGTANSGGKLSISDAWAGTIATFKAATLTNLALTGTSATNYTLTGATGSVTITPKALTLTTTPAVTGKTYDGLAAAALTGAALQGAQAAGTGTTSDGKPYTGDTVNLTLSGTFDTKDAGTGKAVTSTSTLTGANAGNYTLTHPTGLTGTITPKALTLAATPAVTNKTYDGLNAAALTGATLRSAESPGTGTSGDGTPYAGDTVNLALSGTFVTKDAGTGKAVTSTSTLTGANAGNYTLTHPTGLTGTITPASLTVTADNQGKTYGQTLVFGSGSTRFTSSGLQHDETIGSVTLACAGGDPAAAVASYPITPGAAAGGTFSADNYTIGYVPGTLTVMTAYKAWAGSVTFDADTNNDGVANGLAWLLGAAGPTANASALLPKPTHEGGKLAIVFRCLKTAKRGGAVLKLQYSNDLSQADAWTSHEAVVPDADSTVNGVVFTTSANANPDLINVRAEIPADTASPSGKLFCRLYSSAE